MIFTFLQFLCVFFFLACKTSNYQSAELANEDCVVKGIKPPIANLAENTVLYTWTNDPLALQDVDAFVKKSSIGLSGISKEDRGRERVTDLNRKALCPVIFEINDIGRGKLDSQRQIRGVLSSKGIMGGFGLYLATDPLTSIMYGRTLVQVILKASSIANTSKIDRDTGSLDWQLVAKAVLSDQPLVAYPWQNGIFGSSPYDIAFVARSADVIKSAKVLIKPVQPRPLLFSAFPAFDRNHLKLEDILTLAANQGSFFTGLLAIGDSPDSIAEFAIFSELASGGHRPDWYSDLKDKCSSDFTCSNMVRNALQGIDSEIDLGQAVKALKKVGYLSSNFSSTSSAEAHAMLIREFQKTQGFQNAKSWYQGTISLLTDSKKGLVSKPTYLENYM